MKRNIMKFSILFSILLIASLQAQWEQDLRLTNDPSSSNLSYGSARCIAVNGNNLYVVLYDVRDGNWEIYFKRSTDSGLSWGMDLRLTNDPAFSISPSIGVTDSVLHVVWSDFRDGSYEIYYKRSSDGGLVWGPDIRLSDLPYTSLYPSIAVFGSTVHVVWQDRRDEGGYEDIYYKNSTDGGLSWGADTRLIYDPYGKKIDASVAVSESRVHVIWYGENLGRDIFYKRSTNLGEQWEDEWRLLSIFSYPGYHSISATGSYIYIVWDDTNYGGHNLFLKRSTNGGDSWDPDYLLTFNQSGFSAFAPSVFSSGSFVHVVWTDERNGNNEIYYKYSSDYGLTWSDDIRLTYDPASSSFPCIVTSGSTVNVAWIDERDGNKEIYYKRDPTGNTIPVELTSFITNAIESTVKLNWQTATETNNSGFEIERKQVSSPQSSVSNQEWNEIAFVPGYGTTTEPKSYSFIDENLSSGKYQYRLKQIDFDGSFEYSQVVEVEITSPTEFSLGQNYPNPFNPGTVISYSLSQKEFVTIKVRDILGREVATLVNEVKSAGKFKVEFDASSLASGVYLYQINAGTFTSSKKMLLTK